jgi:hypothetical protein
LATGQRAQTAEKKSLAIVHKRDLAKFGYRSETTAEKFRNHAIFWRHAKTYSLNTAISNFQKIKIPPCSVRPVFAKKCPSLDESQYSGNIAIEKPPKTTCGKHKWFWAKCFREISPILLKKKPFPNLLLNPSKDRTQVNRSDVFLYF